MDKYVVQTKSGKIKGFQDDGIIKYLGIPYAEVPVGELRLKRAVAIQPWDDIFDAKEYKKCAVQFDKGQVMGDEDCLGINVLRPLEGEDLPVMVFIHGGGYNTGQTYDTMYTGEDFVRDGVIFVSFSYRMNILGFYDFTTYKGCEEFDSNCGLSDQIMAMNWIHDNIAAFGGNPDNITIFGESAGASSVITMMAAPGTKGCFQKAIIQSGLPNCVMSHELAKENVDLFMEYMGFTEENLAEHIKNDDPRTFLPGNTHVIQKNQYRNPGMFLPGPVVDDIFPVRSMDAIKKGAAKGVKVIIGTNKAEGSMFVYPENTGFPNSWEMVKEMLDKNGHSEKFEDIKKYYEGFGEGLAPFIEFATDYVFKVPSIQLAKYMAVEGDEVYMYHYELSTKGLNKIGWGATHASELPAVFGVRNHEFSNMVFDGEEDSLYETMHNKMHGDWVRFAKHGSTEDDWKPFKDYENVIRVYDRETVDKNVDRTDLIELWGDMEFYEK